jgi:hypothetical protein
VLCGQPSTSQLADGVQFLAEQEQYFQVPDGEAPKAKSGLSPQDQALATFCQALLSSNAFLYVD